VSTASLETNPPASKCQGKILLVDDEPALVRILARVLTSAGHEVITAHDGQEAVEQLSLNTFEVVLSDIDMPRMSGITLLRAIREHDPDVPVILMTGAPNLDTAIEAVRHGALLYLSKPIDSDELLSVLQRAVRLARIARVKQEAMVLMNRGGQGIGDRVAAETSLDRALSTMWLAFQPIVRASDRSLYGYEALLRSREATLPHPGAVLDAAERLGRIHLLGQKVRTLAAAEVIGVPTGCTFFVNLHPADLNDENLFSDQSTLSACASRVILEITERSSLEGVKDLRTKLAKLRGMGFRIAIDDLGAGYSGLTSLTSLEPEVVKLDMSLIRDVDKNPKKEKLVRSMTSLCRDLGMLVVAEGIETPEERDTLVALGCDLLQGYLFAKPAEPFPSFTW
jgi:EAL domain-containing protein (putative c-di-GMP-specific phosphodiesterase class I)